MPQSQKKDKYTSSMISHVESRAVLFLSVSVARIKRVESRGILQERWTAVTAPVLTSAKKVVCATASL